MTNDQDTPKLPFTPPRLTVYGDLREVTQTVGTRGAFDSGAKTTRTRP